VYEHVFELGKRWRLHNLARHRPHPPTREDAGVTDEQPLGQCRQARKLIGECVSGSAPRASQVQGDRRRAQNAADTTTGHKPACTGPTGSVRADLSRIPHDLRPICEAQSRAPFVATVEMQRRLKMPTDCLTTDVMSR